MSVICKLNGLIFGASADPAEQAPLQSVPHPYQAQSTKTGDNEPRFSESDTLAVQQRAETVLRAFDESLNIATQSKNRGTREYKLQIAREWLIELKKLTNKFPFLHLKNLQAVEARIIAVEAETRSLTYGEVVDTSSKDVPNKAQPESLALQSEEVDSHVRSGQISNAQILQGFFRVINESIAIARKSKNLEIKISRLRVARDRLKMAREQASQFSLDVKGFDEAEAEINRIDVAIKTGTPTEISGMQQIDENAAYSSAARTLLKEATALKREKKYIEACDKLREAYSADGAENLFVEERLRLPMYLQRAGKNDEGWDELNRLFARYTDQFSQPRIAAQMATFLRKEGKCKDAALFAVWTLCKQKESYVGIHASMVQSADHQPASDAEWEALGLSPWPQMPVTGTTPSGNPIYDVSYPSVQRCLTEDYDPAAIRAALDRDLAKVVAKEIIFAVVTDLSCYLAKPPPYDLESVKRILAKHLA